MAAEFITRPKLLFRMFVYTLRFRSSGWQIVFFAERLDDFNGRLVHLEVHALGRNKEFE
jgi:hypothetical protein